MAADPGRHRGFRPAITATITITITITAIRRPTVAATKTRHRLLAAVAVIVTAGACASACSASSGAEPSVQARSSQPSTTPTPSSTAFCSVAVPAALTQAETSGAIAAKTGETLVPAAVAPDGSSFFAMDGNGVQNLKNLIWSRDHGSKQQTVFTLSAPYAGYGLVSFDGRWLIFMADHSQQLTGAWDLYAWDSQGSAAPHIIASDPGTAPNAPVEWPQVRGGKATWVQGLADGTQQVHLYDLAAGHDKVVHTGHLGSSLFAGDLLVWTEALQADGPVTLAAVSTATGAPATLPAPLAQAQTAPAAIASDGSTWAWTSADYRTLYAWHAGMPAAVTVHTADEGDAMDSLGASGDVVTWTDSTATFAADLKTGSFTQVTKQYGSALTNGDAVAVYYPLGDVKSPDLTYDAYVLRASALTALPKCSA